MWSVILCIFTPAVFVIILNQVLKNGGVEIIFFIKYPLKAKVDKLIDNGFAEGIAFGGVGNVFTNPVEKRYLGSGLGFNDSVQKSV